MIERLLWLLKWLETTEGTQDERKITKATKMRPLKWLETKEGTQEDREIIKANKMARNQRENSRG